MEGNMDKTQEKEENYLKPIWNTKVPDTELEKFKQVVEKKYNIQFGSYWDLHNWSVKHFENFWHEVWQYFHIISSKPYQKVLVKNGPGFLDNTWFEGATMNYAENLLRNRDDTIAINYVDTDGVKESVTFNELYEQVCLYAAAFRKNGLKKGDRVGCYMSNRKESIIAMLAAVSIGAIWGGAHPLYGPKFSSKIMERMQPKFIISVDRFPWDVEHEILHCLPVVIKGISSIQKVIIVPTKQETLKKDLSFIENSCLLDDFLMSGKCADGQIPEVEFEQVSLDHPVFLCFTSGTTGTPKGIIHSGKILLSMAVSLGLHTNLKRGDAIFSHYAVGWILWNFFVNSLALGVKLILHEGYPVHTADGYNYWDKVEEYGATSIFVVPSCLERMKQLRFFPSASCNFKKLKMVQIGGSPVKMENIQYVHDYLSKDIFAASLYASTENIGFVTGWDWNLPLYGTESQVPALGIDLQCLDANGISVVGERGELVIATPSPALPIGLLMDDNKIILTESYLKKYPGFWCQNDLCCINSRTRGITIYGRSDDTITQNGERYLPSDIYFAIQDMEELEDYLCVPQVKADDDRAVLFLKLKRGQHFTQDLKEKITNKVSEELWRDLVPKVMLPVTDIPYNLNGKKMESIVKKIIATNTILDASNIINPECLSQFCNIPEIVEYNKD